MGFFRPPAVVITTAAQSRREEIRRRELKYVLTMLVRVVLFVLAATLFHGVLRWIAMFLALLLPWLAVVVANAPFSPTGGAPAPVTPRDTASLPPARERVVDGEWRQSAGRPSLRDRTGERPPTAS